jgi:2-dehydro-3-deoxygalactonokinase
MNDAVVLGDWGTSRLRLYLWQAGRIEQHCEGPGVAALQTSAAQALHACLAPWRQRHGLNRVWLCGMAGSRNGLFEVPYLSTPLTAERWCSRAADLQSDDLTITVAAGVAATNALDGPDVMRGEETQAFGALDLEPSLAQGRHLLLLPGTHSKWVAIEHGILQGFTTFITGELYALLRTHSTLLRAASAADGALQAAHPASVAHAQRYTEGFSAGLERARARGSALSALLFETRSAQLTQARSGAWAADFLSGVLLGAEVGAALQAMPGMRRLHLIGEPGLTARYRQALQAHDIEVAELDGDRCALAGLGRLAGLPAREL